MHPEVALDGPRNLADKESDVASSTWYVGNRDQITEIERADYENDGDIKRRMRTKKIDRSEWTQPEGHDAPSMDLGSQRIDEIRPVNGSERA